MFGHLPLGSFQGVFCVRYAQHVTTLAWLGLANLFVEPVAGLERYVVRGPRCT